MREMAEKYDIDGIQFDYIRYPDAPSYDFDYGSVSRHEFERKLGRPVQSWPADVLSGPGGLASWLRQSQLAGKIESLNASVAAAVLLYEARRQRQRTAAATVDA